MPGLKGELAVRIDDGVSDRVVSGFCSGLKFSKAAPGGHQRISFSMALPRRTFSDLGADSRVYLSDTRTGRAIFDGYLENPTPVDGPAGQRYAISAVGGMARASDETRSLIYVDKTLDSWDKDPFSASEANSETGIWAGDGVSPRLRLQLPDGQVVATNAFAGADTRAMQRAGMNFGGIAFGVQSGKVDSGWKVTLDHPLGSVALTATITTTGAGFALFVGDNFPADTQYAALRLVRTGFPTNVADNDTWTDITNISTLGQRMNRFGTPLVGAAGLGSANTVLASQVVEDLLGRLLTFCDPTVAQVDPTTQTINQLAYPDGAKASGVLSDLAVYEADLLWEILETLPNGLHRFNYRAWPSTPRYEISVKDGWSQTGSDVDSCNRILVTWTDPLGATQITTVTAEGAGLVDPLPGRVKDADPITLPTGHGSAANALRIGTQILADKINPPVAGVATVRRPILDHYTGMKVKPWELEPGYLCRVRELGLNLRLTEADYDDDTVSMQVQLGTPLLTEDQRLVRIESASPQIHIAA